jgi:hypothetical protein
VYSIETVEGSYGVMEDAAVDGLVVCNIRYLLPVGNIKIITKIKIKTINGELIRKKKKFLASNYHAYAVLHLYCAQSGIEKVSQVEYVISNKLQY